MQTGDDLTDKPLSELLSLHGRTAVVTGGADGIGKAIAKRLYEAGACVMIGDLDEQKAQAVAKDIDPKGKRALACFFDAANSHSINTLAEQAKQTFGQLDIWVNNVGMRIENSLLKITDQQFDKVIDTNLRGYFVGAREGAKRMGSKGVIINIVSVTSYVVRSSPADYVISKHGVIGLTKSLAVELGPGIRTIAIAPTITESPGVAAERAAGLGPEIDAYAKSLPLKRIGHPDDTARVVVFAVSDMAAFVTGSTIAVEGGDLAR